MYFENCININTNNRQKRNLENIMENKRIYMVKEKEKMSVNNK